MENNTLIDIRNLQQPFLTTYWGLWSQNIKLEDVSSEIDTISKDIAEIKVQLDILNVRFLKLEKAATVLEIVL